MKTNSIDLFEALQEDRLIQLAEDIRELPEADAYQDYVEQAFWELITEEENHDTETVPYEHLPRKSQKLIGYENADNQTIPWWLKQFNWTVVFVEDDSLVLNSKTLPEFVDRHGGDTILEKPSLKTDRGLYAVISALHDLREEIEDSLNIDTSATSKKEIKSLSEIDVFESRMPPQTTYEYRRWIESILELCPPFNRTSTALMYANCGIEYKYFQSLSDNAGYDNNHMKNILEDSSVSSDIRDSFEEMTGFDKEFDYTFEEHESLPNLEALIYRSWQPAAEYQELIEKARTSDKLNNQTDFVGRILLAPIRINSGKKIQFITFGYIYSEDEKRRADVIADLFLSDLE